MDFADSTKFFRRKVKTTVSGIGSTFAGRESTFSGRKLTNLQLTNLQNYFSNGTWTFEK